MLAGGAGARLGGDKAGAPLAGRPLLAHAVAILRAAGLEVVVVAKPSSVLPAVPGVPVWREPEEPRHPRAGVEHALAGAAGRDVLVCAVDLPCVRPATITAMLASAPGRVSVAAGPDGRIQPLLARYPAGVLPALRAAPAAEALTRTVLGLGPVLVPVPADELRNVNTAEDLAAAAAALE